MGSILFEHRIKKTKSVADRNGNFDGMYESGGSSTHTFLKVQSVWYVQF